MPDAKIVPREPTLEMMRAGARTIHDEDWSFSDLWRDMYDAAPAQAEPPIDADARDDIALAQFVARQKPLGIDIPNRAELYDAAPSPAAEDALVERLRNACSKMNDEICQTLGKALGYPWFKDDPKNFPDATEAHGVCVGDHVAESLASEAAARIERQAQEIAEERAAYMRVLDLWGQQEKLCDKYLGELNAALRRAEALHTALRKQVLGHKYTITAPEPKRYIMWCDLCEVEWTHGDPEPTHAEGCLASPAETK